MDCEDARAALHPYLDDELDAGDRSRLEAHLGGCTACETALAGFRSLRTAVRGAAGRHRAPAGLAARIGASLPEGAAPAPLPPARANLSRRWLPLAASVLLTAALASGITLSLAGRGAERRADEEAVAAHVRSLMADHLTDVASADQHTVRPWFSGRIDMAPPVRDLAAEGFPLVGGRLDYLARRASAALVYRHGPHVINVFVRPTTEAAATAPTIRSLQGYLIAEWSAGGLAYTVVSDLGHDEMARLAALLATAPSTPAPPGPR